MSEEGRKERSMPRSKGSEMGQQRQSPRAPLHLKTTSSSDSNQRPIRDRSPKLEEHRRSPRSPLTEVGVCTQKKKGTRVADLETRLGHAKEELRKLREQLASAENAKRDAQSELEETKKLIPNNQLVTTQEEEEEEEEVVVVVEEEEEEEEEEVEEALKDKSGNGAVEGESVDVEEPKNPDSSPEVEKEEVSFTVLDSSVAVKSMDSDVDVVEQVKSDNAEVPEEKIEVVKEEEQHIKDGPSGEKATETVVTCSDPVEAKEALESLDKTEEKTLEVEDKTEKMDNDRVENYAVENSALKKQLDEAKAMIAAAKAKEDEMGVKMRSLTEELEHSRAKSAHLEEQLESVEAAKTQLEKETKRLRIQTDQWRKAADAAADIISGEGGISGFDMNAGSGGRRMSERCGSMDKHHLGVGMVCESTGNLYLGSPSELDEGFGGNGKRKSAGIRMFGELWKKKGQQK